MRQLNLLNNQLTHSTLQLYIRRRWWWWKLSIINKPMTLVFERFCHDSDFVNRTWLWAPFIREGWYSSRRVLKRKEVKLQTAYSFTLRYCKKTFFPSFLKAQEDAEAWRSIVMPLEEVTIFCCCYFDILNRKSWFLCMFVCTMNH